LAFWPRRRNTPGVTGSATFLFFEAVLVLVFLALRFPAVVLPFEELEEVRDAGSKAVAFSTKFSQEYGDGEAGMIESQIIASEARVCVLVLSEEEYVA
jgi:hypothetical protein